MTQITEGTPMKIKPIKVWMTFPLEGLITRSGAIWKVGSLIHNTEEEARFQTNDEFKIIPVLITPLTPSKRKGIK